MRPQHPCLIRAAICGAVLIIACRGAAAPAMDPAPPENTHAEVGVARLFETDVQPILQQKCVRCHGDETREAGLDLTGAAGALKGGESGLAIQPGKPQESLLFEKVSQGLMPPDDSLSAEQIEQIRVWIASGARSREQPAGPQVTQQQIIPLMLLRCSACHGGRRTEAGLDLRTKAGMLRGGESGPAAISGRPADSLLIQRIRNGEMPPRRQLVSVSVKPMEAAELELLESWIAAGMPEDGSAPDAATVEPDNLVSDEDRAFWSFQPPQTRVPPPVDAAETCANPLDAFILKDLESRQLSFSPEADRLTLLRRVSFDLTGLPPSIEDIRTFVDDPDPQAYERLIDRLLASAEYGARWGRHWLDIAGYADSEGAQNEDRLRPEMWRYRDYVIQAFNADKPYDRFLTEQLAGDELADYSSAEQITTELYDNLVATGFLRTAPDRTFADITNFVPDRLEVVADEIQVFSSAMLGLTMHCARCHSHKFDPIPQRDYYRLAAIFKDAFDEHDWLKPEERILPFVTATERQQWSEHDGRLNDQIKTLQQQLEAESDQTAKAALESRVKELEAQRTPEPRIRALWSRGVPSPTYLLRRGNYLTPGPEVGPGVPSVLTNGRTPFEHAPPWPGAASTGRRLALARWLCAPDHPLTSRVMVNRLWQQHFGRGLVETPGNFGTAGALPTHPELLDWLAVELVGEEAGGRSRGSGGPQANIEHSTLNIEHRTATDNGPRTTDTPRVPASDLPASRLPWSLKRMHRLMLTSTTYRQSSRVTEPAARLDPEGGLLSRMPLRRMEGEVVRDSLLALAGRLDQRQFGPPDPVEVRPDGLVTEAPSPGGWRRSIFVLQRRTTLPTILEGFDAPEMNPNCLDRRESIVSLQALHLLNNNTVHELAGDFAERVRREVGEDREAQIESVHLLAYARPPDQEERAVAREMLDRLTRQWTDQPRDAASEPLDSPAAAARQALHNYCHAVMNSAAFLYID